MFSLRFYFNGSQGYPQHSSPRHKDPYPLLTGMVEKFLPSLPLCWLEEGASHSPEFIARLGISHLRVAQGPESYLSGIVLASYI